LCCGARGGGRLLLWVVVDFILCPVRWPLAFTGTTVGRTAAASVPLSYRLEKNNKLWRSGGMFPRRGHVAKIVFVFFRFSAAVASSTRLLNVMIYRGRFLVAKAHG
jgi:hypothetical protein